MKIPHTPPDFNRQAKLDAFDRLLTIMDQLRMHCPWDKKQNFQSLRHLTIEETYELADAIIDEDLTEIKKELGDIMLHMVFYSKLGDEAKQFDVADVLNGVCDKLINRHPHIYADTQATTEEEVKQNWEKIKLKEGNKSVLGGVPRSLPALVKAMRIQEKAKGVGFDWDNKQQVWDKVLEEIDELHTETEKPNNHDNITDEFGDVMFSLINYARFLNINAEEALEKTNKKFMSRFSAIEAEAQANGKSLKDLTLAEMESMWQKAK